MRIRRSALFLTLLFVSGLLGACSDQRASVDSPHPLGRAWLVESASFHGDSFEQNLMPCDKCHDLASFCTQCHFDPNQADVRVPPGSGWIHGFPPPSHRDLGQYENTCNRCHAILRSYSAGPAACHDCHGSASPHPGGWLDPTNPNFHGPSAQTDLDTCRECHGQDLMGGAVGVSCFSCHFGPDGSRQPADVDPADWTHASARTRHAADGVFSADDQAVCAECHQVENEFTGSPTFTDCSTSTCHPSLADAYHGLDFFDGHPAAARENIGSCQPCHDTPAATPNFDGYVTGVACVACHDQGIAHPPGPQGLDWYVDHRSTGNHASACAICHDVQQGRTPPLAAAPSCFSTQFGGQGCHAGGPGTAPHPVGTYVDPALHGADAKGDPGLVFCQGCHATPTSGNSPTPRFNVPIGELPNGCETCHAPETAHPSPAAGDVGSTHWYGSTVTHRDAKNLAVSCALCHGANLEGGVGPACTTCHTASPLTEPGPCSSCHGAPPNSQPADTAPNRQGAHGAHNARPDVTGVCATCHNGGGTRTDEHFNDQRRPFLSIQNNAGAYKAQTSAADEPKFTVTDAATGNGTCSGVSCHGGQVTPHWLTETLDVSTACTRCHLVETGRTQYNSAVSGEHDFHVNELGFPCANCHNVNELDPALNPNSGHFANLKTTAMEGPASATIGGGATKVSTYQATGQNCTPVDGIGCHGTRSWTGD